MTLTDFLLARIAEDEAMARAATPSPWRASTIYPNVREDHPDADKPCQYAVDCSPVTLTAGPEFEVIPAVTFERAQGWSDVAVWDDEEPNFRDAEADSRHIARHDPARVLAECEAKRRIVARCVRLIESFAAADRSAAMWSDVTRRERSHAQATLHDLALSYANHPDYGDTPRG